MTPDWLAGKLELMARGNLALDEKQILEAAATALRSSARPEVEFRNAVLEEAADLADQNLDHYSGTECTYRGDVAEKIRELKRRLPQRDVKEKP